MSSESHWIERAQSAEARLATMEQSMKPALERVREFKAAFGVKERSDGTLIIDFDKFATALGAEGALELRRIIDEKYQITGAAGEKPRMRVAG